MADNVTANAGSGGATFATDDDGTAHHPYVKVEWGGNDTQTPVASGASALPIQDGGNSITIDGTVTANLSATDNAVLDTIETNTDFGAVTGGGVEASALRVTLANDSTGVVSVDDNGGSLTVDNADITTIAGAVSGSEMQVDVVAALPAGTNAIGKLAANSGVDIGDVDVTSVPNGTSHYRNIDANAEAAIKGSAGTLYWVHVMNMTAAVAYLHLYDATTASVTPGTTTPDYTFPIPTQGDTNGAGFMVPFPGGQAFANAITLVCTTTTDGSAGDPGTNGVFVNAGYA